jgi:hypothetical protein
MPPPPTKKACELLALALSAPDNVDLTLGENQHRPCHKTKRDRDKSCTTRQRAITIHR